MSHPGNDAVIEQIRDQVAEMSHVEKVNIVIAHNPHWVSRFRDQIAEMLGKYLDIAVADVLIETWPEGGDE
ncbi:MAG TPA: hypothetical protein DIT46_02855 [Gemmatimonadetes bacterium]|nr:hypothetical protein [Gemmatimonadota bacterium]|tara:strand:+ start:334 stop:546 length:213 start_codon:yes stop_codon:yes gene_type:complete